MRIMVIENNVSQMHSNTVFLPYLCIRLDVIVTKCISTLQPKDAMITVVANNLK